MSEGKSISSRRTGACLLGALTILLLAASVFTWGLHSKLSLYRINQRVALSTPVAKLLSERERPAAAEQQTGVRYPDRPIALLAAAAALLAPAAPRLRPVRTALRHLPGPLVLRGPSMRRPPPFFLA